MNTNNETVRKIGGVLIDQHEPLSSRFRALFTLRNLGGQTAIDSISACFSDPSALLKHECAYCLGQMQDHGAIPALKNVLQDQSQETIVRHEAGEALGAIGSPAVMDILKEYKDSPVQEIAETCQLAIQRIEWLQTQSTKPVEETKLSTNPFQSVDPAPPAAETSIEVLQNRLLDEKLSLFDRYRAMFALRNHNSEESTKALAEGFQCSSALFRHEIAYVLGQMQNKACIQQLIHQLGNLEESSMVRHECAEALGSIAQDGCHDILKEYTKDTERVVRESCEVALDMCEYEQSEELHYADSLIKLQEVKT